MGKNRKKKKNQDKKLHSNRETKNNRNATKNFIVEEKREDFISRLPNDILCRIISFLPFKSAVKTSFLSRRWKDLWKMALVQHGTIEEAVIAISSFLMNFGEVHLSRSNWGFQFNYGKDSVLLAAVAPRNKLHLDFSTGTQEFPRQFGWQLEVNGQNLNQQPSSSSFFVKTLYLLSVSYNTIEAVSSMVSNLPFLESLTIAKCNGLRSLHIKASSKLLNFTILDCFQLKSVHIRALQLKSFRYQGLLPWFWPMYQVYLVDAMLDFRQGPGYNGLKNHDFDSILFSIRYVKTITLCRWVFEKFICPSGSSIRWNLQFDKLEELWWVDNSKEEYNSDALFFFLNCCPSVERVFVTIDPKSYNMPSTIMCLDEVVGHTRLRYLKVLKLVGFTNQEDEILLAKRLKEVFSAEPKIIATSDGKCIRSLVKVKETKGEELSYKFVKAVANPIFSSSENESSGDEE